MPAGCLPAAAVFGPGTDGQAFRTGLGLTARRPAAAGLRPGRRRGDLRLGRIGGAGWTDRFGGWCERPTRRLWGAGCQVACGWDGRPCDRIVIPLTAL